MLFSTSAGAAWVGLVPLDWQDNPNNTDIGIKVFSYLKDGDMAQLKRELKKAKKGHQTVVALELASDGGDGDTAVALAEYVAKNDIRVLLRQRCWSACSFPALVALGKGRLLIRDGAEIGVHQARLTEDNTPDPDWTRQTAVRLHKWGAPWPPLQAMIDTPPSTLTYYSYRDLERMGAVALDDDWDWWWE